MSRELAGLVYLTPAQVAARLQLGVSTVRGLCQGGRLPATRIEGQWRIREDALERWLAEQTTPARAPVARHATAPAPTRVVVCDPSDCLFPEAHHPEWAATHKRKVASAR